MALEIEYKFLVKDDSWKEAAFNPRVLTQAYILKGDKKTLRVRIDGDEKAKLTIKASVSDITRQEFEYDIPLEDAKDLLMLASGYVIDKTRYHVEYEGFTWEIDVFSGDNAGLVVAEVEVASEDQDFARPSWVGEDVSTDKRYFNANLSQTPFNQWND